MRAARSKAKSSSKVQFEDEVIFFEDIAGNEAAKVGAEKSNIQVPLRGK